MWRVCAGKRTPEADCDQPDFGTAPAGLLARCIAGIRDPQSPIPNARRRDPRCGVTYKVNKSPQQRSPYPGLIYCLSTCARRQERRDAPPLGGERKKKILKKFWILLIRIEEGPYRTRAVEAFLYAD